MIKNTVIDNGDYVTIIPNGKHSDKHVLLDKEDLLSLGSNTVVINGRGYPCIRKDNIVQKIHNLVLNATTDRNNVVDHKNGNKLDTRKEKLREVTQRVNSRNKQSYSRNLTGEIGISERTRGNYNFFRAQLTLPDSELAHYGQGKRISKNFNIGSLGKEDAFVEAKTWINEQKKILGY